MLKKRTICNGLLACVVALLFFSGCQRSGDTGQANSTGGNAGPGNSPTVANQTGQPPADLSKLDADIARLEPEAERDPDDETTRSTLAQLYFQRGAWRQQNGQLNEAMRDYENALRYDPAHEEATLRLAQITRQLEPEPRADDGKPVAVPAVSPRATREP